MKKKLNIKKIILVLVVLVFIVYGCMKAVKEYVYTGSFEGRLSLVGYTEEEIKTITDVLDNKEIENILKKEYNEDYLLFMKEKYFIFNNLDRYMAYFKKKPKEEISKIVALINVGADEYWYENIKETDISKKELMLVNKFNALKEDYVPEELEQIDTFYAYDNVSIRKEIVSIFEELCDKAKDAGYTFVASLGYRSYTEQYDSYYSYKSYNGTRKADEDVAHAGHSDHQTGYALEIEPFDLLVEDINKSAEHKWLINNAYKFGFILRYPEGKEDITGYNYEPWHFRYVGESVAMKIHKENITYDEYYAYYIEAKK